MNLYAYLWLGLLVVFLMIEGASVALVSVWFAIGAVAAAIAALLGASLIIQIFLPCHYSCRSRYTINFTSVISFLLKEYL